MRLTTSPFRSRGTPPALPRSLDDAAEWWARRTPRTRLALAAMAALILLAMAGAGAARSPWGEARTVLVAGRDLAPGTVLAPGDVRAADWPARLVPDDALTELPAGDATGVLVVGAPAGTLLTARHLGRAGLAAGLPASRAAVPVTVPDGVTLAAGQRVDLLAGDRDGTGRLLAADARVLRVEAGTVWVDVSRDDAPDLAAASDWGAITVAVVGADPG